MFVCKTPADTHIDLCYCTRYNYLIQNKRLVEAHGFQGDPQVFIVVLQVFCFHLSELEISLTRYAAIPQFNFFCREN